MSALQVGDRAPDFCASTTSGEEVQLSELVHERIVVLFFYPKDDSPICTAEACQFRDSHEDFVDAGAVVIGISRDSDAAHQRFAQRHQLPFLLISDSDDAIRRAFGVPKTFGLLPGRVTYVIGHDQTIRHLLNSQFTSSRHVREALEVVKSLTKASVE